MVKVMAALPNIGGILYKTSLIPFLVPRHKVWLMPTTQVPCSNAANIGERKTWTRSEFAKIPLGGKSPGKCIYSLPAQETAKHHAVWLTSGERRRCSSEANTQKPLKFAGLPQTLKPISATSEPFGILWGQIFPTIDSLPASGLTPRLYDWSVSSEHLFLFLVFFISLFCCGSVRQIKLAIS